MEAQKSPRHEPIWRVVPLNARQSESSIPPSFTSGNLPQPSLRSSSRSTVVHDYENHRTSSHHRSGSRRSRSRNNDPVIEETVHRILEYPSKAHPATGNNGNTVHLPRYPGPHAGGGDTELYQAVMNMQQRSKEARYAAAVKTKDNILKDTGSGSPPVLPYKDQLSKVEQAVAELKQSIAVHPPTVPKSVSDRRSLPIPRTVTSVKSKSTVYGNDPWNVPVTNPKAGVRIYEPPKIIPGTRNNHSRTSTTTRNHPIEVVLPGANVGIQADVAGYVLPELPRKHVQAVGETATQTDLVETVAQYKKNGYDNIRHKNITKENIPRSKENKPPFDLHTCTHHCQHTTGTEHTGEGTLVGIRRTGGGYTNVVRARSGTAATKTRKPTMTVNENQKKDTPNDANDDNEEEEEECIEIPLPRSSSTIPLTASNTVVPPSSSSITMEQLLTFVSVFGSELAKNMGQATANMIQQTLLFSVPSASLSLSPSSLPQPGLNDSFGSTNHRRPSIGRDQHLLTPRQRQFDTLRTETSNLVNTAKDLQTNMNTMITELLDRELRVNTLATELSNNASSSVAGKPPLPLSSSNPKTMEHLVPSSAPAIHKYKATLKSTVTVTPRRKTSSDDVVYDTTIMNANINVMPVGSSEYTGVSSSATTGNTVDMKITNATVSRVLPDNATNTAPSTEKKTEEASSSSNDYSTTILSSSIHIQSTDSVFKPISSLNNKDSTNEQDIPQIHRQRIHGNDKTKIEESSLPVQPDIPASTVTEDPNKNEPVIHHPDPYLDLLRSMEKDISSDDKEALRMVPSSSTVVNTTTGYESLSHFPHPASIGSVSRSSDDSRNSTSSRSSKNSISLRQFAADGKKSTTTQAVASRDSQPSTARTVPVPLIENPSKSSTTSHRSLSVVSSVIEATNQEIFRTDRFNEISSQIPEVPSYARNSVLGALLAQNDRSVSTSRASSVRLRADSLLDNVSVHSSSRIVPSRPSSSLASSVGKRSGSTSNNINEDKNGSVKSSARVSPLVMQLAEIAIQDAQKAISKVTLE